MIIIIIHFSVSTHRGMLGNPHVSGMKVEEDFNQQKTEKGMMKKMHIYCSEFGSHFTQFLL